MLAWLKKDYGNSLFRSVRRARDAKERGTNDHANIKRKKSATNFSRVVFAHSTDLTQESGTSRGPG